MKEYEIHVCASYKTQGGSKEWKTLLFTYQEYLDILKKDTEIIDSLLNKTATGNHSEISHVCFMKKHICNTLFTFMQ